MCKNKFSNNWWKLVASSSFNCIAQIKVYALEIQQCVLRSIEIFVSWTNFFFEVKFFWNEKCAETITTTRRRRRKWTALHIEKTWQNNLKTSKEKKRIIAKKKIEFKQIFRIICDTSSNFWRLIRWARTRSYKSKNTSKISNLLRRDVENNVFEITTNFEFKIRFLSKFFFSTRSKSISSTYRILIISTSYRNRRFLSQKMKFDKRLNDANRTIRQNLTTFRIAFSKYSLTN